MGRLWYKWARHARSDAKVQRQHNKSFYLIGKGSRAGLAWGRWAMFWTSGESCKRPRNIDGLVLHCCIYSNEGITILSLNRRYCTWEKLNWCCSYHYDYITNIIELLLIRKKKWPTIFTTHLNRCYEVVEMDSKPWYIPVSMHILHAYPWCQTPSKTIIPEWTYFIYQQIFLK